MKKFSFVLTIVAVSILISAFTINSNKPKNIINDKSNSTIRDYYFKQCTFCHNQSERLAPYMPNIKKIYLTNYPDETTFINKVTDFVLEPNTEKRLYKSENFKTMPPNMFHDRKKIKDVARYIYRTNNL